MVEVRKAIVNNAKINQDNEIVFRSALKDSSYNIVETALLKLWEYDPFNHTALLENIKDLDGQAMALKVRYLEMGTEAFPDLENQFIGQLSELCGPKYEFRIRINAMQALQRLNACNVLLVNNLMDAMISFNTRLGAPAKDVLAYFMQQTDYKRLITATVNNSKIADAEKAKIKASLGI
jgi:polyhydroxyalkanoate synthesis regulator protein